MAEKIKLPKKVVVDASFILSLFFPEENNKEKTKEILHSYQKNEINFCAPNLLPYEVINGLKSAVKRKIINQSQAKRMVSNFFKLKINYLSPDFRKAFSLSLKFDLSVYDAAYLTLARQHKLTLFTFDQKLNSC